eukprot:TRINITY_DN4189_c0_g1_i2.p1 TRINITY_DN4189_c0_g1~~TRINITY_DN4189_c0_g1_i2.p1  ORF type:complete len:205 (+),score=31.65 TRINITY_DN4189_c0_g1_i2:76-615(+)
MTAQSQFGASTNASQSYAQPQSGGDASVQITKEDLMRMRSGVSSMGLQDERGPTRGPSVSFSGPSGAQTPQGPSPFVSYGASGFSNSSPQLNVSPSILSQQGTGYEYVSNSSSQKQAAPLRSEDGLGYITNLTPDMVLDETSCRVSAEELRKLRAHISTSTPQNFRSPSQDYMSKKDGQ